MIIALVAFLGAILSFLSGFGLGTLLLPAFMAFFPVPVAVASTAVVHLMNTLFKLFLVGKNADRQTVIVFGTWSVIGAFAGALVLGSFTSSVALVEYNFGSKTLSIFPMNLTMGILILVFTVLEISPLLSNVVIGKKWFPLGGAISGFFGGLSGHQGALRSAFLMKTGLSKEAFIGSRAVIACMVDLTRLSVYAFAIQAAWQSVDVGILAAATVAAIAGAYIGNKLSLKMEWLWINRLITVCLLIFSVALIIGLI